MSLRVHAPRGPRTGSAKAISCRVSAPRRDCRVASLLAMTVELRAEPVGVGFEGAPGGGIELRLPARVEIAEFGADAHRVGAVDDHAELGKRGFPGDVERFDL